MQIQHSDWFHNALSNNDLREILSDLHYLKFGNSYYLETAGRCVLARELEAFGPYNQHQPILH